MFFEEVTIFGDVFRFYSKALAFPYNEMGFEFQHLFRQMEVACRSDEDEQLAARVLQVINNFQGEEISALQAEYTRMFTHEPASRPDVSIYMADYSNSETADALIARMYESDLGDMYDETPETITHLLNYAAQISDENDPESQLSELPQIINPFSQHLYKGTTLGFYKEVAKGLSEICLVITS